MSPTENWLTLEKSGIRHQRRDLGVEEFRDPFPDLPARRSLVLTAAHTVFPEAGLDVLPGIARDEVERGTAGPLREALAECADDDPGIEGLRDELLPRLSGGRTGRPAAIVVADQVHLRRLVRGTVPAVIAVGNLLWYGAYRRDIDPHSEVVRTLGELHEAWRRSPAERDDLQERIRQIAVEVVGEQPDDLLDAEV